MRETVRIPLLLPLGKRPLLCATEIELDFIEHDSASAPVACRIQVGRGPRARPMPIESFRWSEGSFYKVLNSDPALSADASMLRSATLMNDLLTGLPFKSQFSPKASAMAYSRLSGYGHKPSAQLAELVRAVPSLSDIRDSDVDRELVGLGIEKAVARLSELTRIDGIWHEACPEPLIRNIYTPMGVRHGFGAASIYAGRDAEPHAPDQSYVACGHWAFFPMHKLDDARAEAEALGERTGEFGAANDIASIETPMPEVFGIGLMEREMERQMRSVCHQCIESLHSKANRWKKWVPREICASVDRLHDRLEGLDLSRHQSPPAEAEFRHLLGLVEDFRDAAGHPDDWLYARYARMFLDRWDMRELDISFGAIEGLHP